ncbi:MAG: radical SAM protein [Bacteroidia bacterium]|nr:radical SAM protein [Bacteroidia bacterium]
MKDLLLLTPPFTQLNTPYPATIYLKGFLNTKNISSFQMDLGIEVIARVFSSMGLRELFELAFRRKSIISANAERVYALRKSYCQSIDSVISFLQGKNATMANRICNGDFLPQASRFDAVVDLEWSFGGMGIQDKAKHLATLYLEDLSDFIIECIDADFGFSRYADRLGMSANSFDDLYEKLQEPCTHLDTIALEILEERLKSIQPKMVGISVPFPGNLYSAFRVAQYLKNQFPFIQIVMGGGFPNTELRGLSDVRVFEFVDFITLDDGELPLEILVSNALNPSVDHKNHGLLKRTFLLQDGRVFYNNFTLKTDYKQHELGTPDYSDLLLDQYISVMEVTNPMHSLWSDGRWNKLTMAHGCYWGKCTFCDGSLDYIKRYEPIDASLLVDRMEQIIAQTGERGFHFVDEAAPPTLMAALALEIIRRKLVVSWWTNIRFEKRFTRDLCRLLKESGCIAVSGGLEVASDRLLKLINKGTNVEQVAVVANNFTQEGMLVHAYLMHAFPTQTVQETVDSLEMVRQLFENNVIQSGFWHHFALTTHSPIALYPAKFGIVPEVLTPTFAKNDVPFTDKTGIDHDLFGFGLKKSLLNFMNGIGFELPLQAWFEFKIPGTIVAKTFIQQCLDKPDSMELKPTTYVYWLGEEPIVKQLSATKKGKAKDLVQLTFHERTQIVQIRLDPLKGLWLLDILKKISVLETVPYRFSQLKEDYEQQFEDFDLFWHSKPISDLRANGLICIF